MTDEEREGYLYLIIILGAMLFIALIGYMISRT